MRGATRIFAVDTNPGKFEVRSDDLVAKFSTAFAL